MRLTRKVLCEINKGSIYTMLASYGHYKLVPQEVFNTLAVMKSPWQDGDFYAKQVLSPFFGDVRIENLEYDIEDFTPYRNITINGRLMRTKWSPELAQDLKMHGIPVGGVFSELFNLMCDHIEMELNP